MSLKIVYGQIASDGDRVRLGTTTSNEVIGATRTDTGQYSVEISPGTFKDNPAVVATVMTSEPQQCTRGTNRVISVTRASPTQICFGIRKGDGDDDRPFAFHAIGPSA